MTRRDNRIPQFTARVPESDCRCGPLGQRGITGTGTHNTAFQKAINVNGCLAVMCVTVYSKLSSCWWAPRASDSILPPTQQQSLYAPIMGGHRWQCDRWTNGHILCNALCSRDYRKRHSSCLFANVRGEPVENCNH